MKLSRRDFSRLLAAAPLALNSSAHAAIENDEKLAAILEGIRINHKLPALAGGIVTTQGLAKAAVTGFRVQGGTTKATLSDLWHLGSNTKAMTATLVAIFVEEGKLHWEDTLVSLFPKAKGLNACDLGSVTLSQLLHHTSGLPPNLKWETIQQATTPVELRAAALLEAVNTKLESKPGTQYLYSNTGYALAGHAIETVAGKPWEVLIKERVFTPLGITSAGLGGLGTPGKDDQPWPHSVAGIPMPVNGPEMDNPPVMSPAGRVHMQLADWAKFIADHLKGAAGEKALLRPASYEVLHKPGLKDYAMGWIVVSRPWAGGLALTHNGTNTMNYSVAWLAPKKGFAILVCTNQGRQDAAADAAAYELIKHHLGMI